MIIGIIAPRPVDPTIVGGAERLWRTLEQRLIERGHQVELVTLPTPEANLAELLDSYEQFVELDVSRFDVVITGKYPAWMIDHPRHLVYLLHPLRGLYDTYPAELSADVDPALEHALGAAATARGVLEMARTQLAANPGLGQFPGPFARAVVHRLDHLAFEQVTQFAAISETVASRPGYLPDRPVLVNHPESGLASRCLRQPLGEVPARTRFVAVSRLDRPKRLDLVLGAFAHYQDRNARLTIAGDGPDRGRLEQLAEADPRIEFLGRVEDDELVDLYHSATAVLFVPLDEDYGYISAEAMAAGAPVITTTDSGGASELLEHGVNGLVLEPDPARLAWGMAHIADNPFTRWQLGLNARRRSSAVDFAPLLDVIEGLGEPPQHRVRALVLSTYPIDPMIGGGQRRLRHLTRALAALADVTVLVLSADVELPRRRLVEPGLVQIEIPRSAAQREAEEDIYALLGLPVDDITASALAPASPAYGEELIRQLDVSDVVIASHPFLAPSVPRSSLVPLIHDSHNVEASLKAAMLPDSTAGRWLLEKVRSSEHEATERAVALFACTQDDLAELQRARPGIAGRVIPNGVDSVGLPMRTPQQAAAARAEVLAVVGVDPEDPRPLALFIGSWHKPNIDAARLIVEVARKRQDWLFVLAGSHTSEFADKAATDRPLPENVHLIAIFSESLLWPLLAGATVALNPMISGGGSNLKLFDYLAVGVPVVATEVGARGLDDASASVVLCAPTAEGVSSGLDEATSRDLAASLRHGRHLVTERYDWRHLGAEWARGVLDAIGAQPSPTPRHPTVVRPPLTLADRIPPPLDPTEATIRAVGHLARTQAPTPKEATVDPIIQESLKQAGDNRHVGRVLPESARLRGPKQALIRVGQFISNEQLNYNEALLDAVNRLATTVETLRRENQTLSERIDRIEAAADADPPPVRPSDRPS